MLAPNQYSTFDASLKNARIIVGLEWVYVSVRDQIGKFLVIVLFIVLGFPLVYLLGFWLRSKRKTLQKTMKREFNGFKSVEDYLEFKSNLSQLSALYHPLKNVSNYKSAKVPLIFRFTFIQMQKMSSTLLTYNNWLTNKLKPFNEEQFKSSNNIFKFIPENELWKNRNTAYKYWM